MREINQAIFAKIGTLTLDCHPDSELWQLQGQLWNCSMIFGLYIFQSLPSILLSAQSPDTYEKVCQWQPQLTWSNDTQQMLIPRSTSNSFTAFMMSSWRLQRAPSGAFVLRITSSIPYSFLFHFIHPFIQYFSD